MFPQWLLIVIVVLAPTKEISWPTKIGLSLFRLKAAVALDADPDQYIVLLEAD